MLEQRADLVCESMGLFNFSICKMSFHQCLWISGATWLTVWWPAQPGPDSMFSIVSTLELIVGAPQHINSPWRSSSPHTSHTSPCCTVLWKRSSSLWMFPSCVVGGSLLSKPPALELQGVIFTRKLGKNKLGLFASISSSFLLGPDFWWGSEVLCFSRLMSYIGSLLPAHVGRPVLVQGCHIWGV